MRLETAITVAQQHTDRPCIRYSQVRLAVAVEVSHIKEGCSPVGYYGTSRNIGVAVASAVPWTFLASEPSGEFRRARIPRDRRGRVAVQL
jgi:hypothetical protein